MILQSLYAQIALIQTGDSVVCEGAKVDITYKLSRNNQAVLVYFKWFMNASLKGIHFSSLDSGVITIELSDAKDELYIEYTLSDSTVITSNTINLYMSIPAARPFMPKLFYGCDEVIFPRDSSRVFAPSDVDSITGKSFTFHQASTDSIEGAFFCKLIIQTALGCSDTGTVFFYLRTPRPKYKLLSDSVACAPHTIKLLNMADMEHQVSIEDTPTYITTFYVLGGNVSPVYSTKRLDTIILTLTTPGKYKIMAVGKTSDFPSGACPPSYYPADPEMATAIYVLSSQVDSISGPAWAEVNQEVFYATTFSPFYDYNWYVSEGEIISGQGTDTVKVKWMGNGPKKVGVSVKNKIRHDLECGTDTIFKEVQVGTLGLNKVFYISKMHIYPNPATLELNINLENNIGLNRAYINISNIQGHAVYQQELLAQPLNNINISHLSPGIYVFTLHHENRVKRQLFVKQ